MKPVGGIGGHSAARRSPTWDSLPGFCLSMNLQPGVLNDSGDRLVEITQRTEVLVDQIEKTATSCKGIGDASDGDSTIVYADDMQGSRWAWFPNGLTVMRLVAGIALPWVPDEWKFWVLLVAGFTDLIDGWISRILKVTSGFGQVVDPIADKTLVLVAVGWAWQAGWLTLLECGLLAARDLAVLAISAAALLWRRANWRKLQPRLSGKLATGGQVAALLGVYWVKAPCPTLALIGGVLSLVAAVDYIVTGWRLRG